MRRVERACGRSFFHQGEGTHPGSRCALLSEVEEGEKFPAGLLQSSLHSQTTKATVVAVGTSCGAGTVSGTAYGIGPPTRAVEDTGHGVFSFAGKNSIAAVMASGYISAGPAEDVYRGSAVAASSLRSSRRAWSYRRNVVLCTVAGLGARVISSAIANRERYPASAPLTERSLVNSGEGLHELFPQLPMLPQARLEVKPALGWK